MAGSPNLLTETYAPIILTERARALRKLDPNAQVYAPTELESRSIKEILAVVLARPLHLLFTEPIVFFVCLFLALLFGIYYMFFEAYPRIFQG